MKKAGLLLRSWLEITPPLRDGIISHNKCKLIRDKILRVLKGSINE